MKRLLVVIVALALLGALAPARAGNVIEFWHAMDGPAGVAIAELVRDFNRSQGEFEVRAVFKGTYYELLTETLAAYRKKTPPNIVQISEVGTLTMFVSETTVPISRLMQQQQIAVDWADFIPTVASYYEKDGKLASMPFNASTPILYYNKDIFRKAGLADAPPATWPEVEAASRKILASGAATCGFTTPSPAWILLENTFPWHDQPYATNENGNKGLDTRLLINGSFGLMHVGALARWQQEGIFFFGGPENTRPNTKFADGECAMVLQSSGNIRTFEQSLPFAWGTGQLPHWGPPYAKARTSLGGATLWVLRGHGRAEESGVAQFLRFLSEPSQQIEWATRTGFVPVTRSAVQRMEAASFFQQNPKYWPGTSQLLEGKVTPFSRGIRLGNYVQVRNAIEIELANIMSGRKTVKEGLDAAVLRGNAILREFAVNNGAAPQGEI
ncbi:MAG: extracellular solute-binding protein [Burkholderiales bacterium]